MREVEMNGRLLAGVAAVGMSVICFSTLASSPTLAQGGGPQSPGGGAAAPAARVPTGNDGAEACALSPICNWGRGRNLISHEVRKPDLRFTYAYPFALPDGLTGGISAVALNSKEHLVAFQRNPGGKQTRLEFDRSN